MEEIELCSSTSSNSSTTVINEPYSTNIPLENIKVSNMYNLSESEDEIPSEEFTYQRQKFEGVQGYKELKELSQKYLPKNSSQQEIVLLSDSSEDEYNINSNFKNDNKTNKDSLLMDLDTNNTIFENFNVLSRPNSLLESEMESMPGSSGKNEVFKPKRPFELVSSSSCEENDTDNNPGRSKTNTKKSRQRTVINTEKKLAAEEKKAIREREKANKKEQLEKEKALKQAQRLIDKCNKPEESLKYITVNMDDSVFNNKEYGDYVKEYFTEKNISYRMKTALPGMISFSRKVLRIENSETIETESLEKHYAVIIKPTAFGNLLSCIQSLKEQTNFKLLSLFVYGLSKPTSIQEDEIISIEILFPTYWQFVKNKEELGNFLFMLTKSISQIPYKLQQAEKYEQQNEYFQDCNKDLVRVDKDGNGLGRLWRQMLTMFPLVRLETSEAITAVYPTPSSLFEAYENCTENAEQLVQNLPIRRTQGPLASSRRIGPEFSKKCYKFFTSEETVLI